jgi:hypothetical protein
MFTPFYNRTIRKMVVAFGTLFNNITMIRYKNDQDEEYERIKVPIIYGPKEKFIERITSDPDLTRSIANHLPKMSFELVGISYDASRKQVTTLKSFGSNSSAANSLKTQSVGVPYDFTFTLSLYVRNIEDGTQIVEQILPYFTPDYILSINLVDGIPETTKNIPFILDSVDSNIDYEGDFSTTRMIIWTLNFTAKGYFFGPLSDSKIIMRRNDGSGIGGANVRFYNESSDTSLQKVYVNSLTGSGTFKDGESIRITGKQTVGTVYSWSANTNIIANTSTLIAKDLTDPLNIGDEVNGDETNARYIVSTLGDTYYALARTETYQNPLSANGVGDFGFTTNIFEFPNA